jgi:hypothetical protein
MSTLSITYTPQYLGDHRICYRLQDLITPDAYCCLIDTTPSIIGTPKVFVITISDPPCASVPGIDPESCVNQIYEGYVQPVCEDEQSLTGRTTWSVSFAPDPSCVSQLICCQQPNGLSNTNITIIDAGNQYDNTLSPLAIIVVRDPLDPVPPGGGNDAVVSVIITGTAVTGISVSVAGLYGKQPTFIVPPPTLVGPQPVTAILQANIECPGVNPAFYEDCSLNARTAALGIDQCVVFCLPKAKPFLYVDVQLNQANTFDYSYTSQGCCNCSTCRNYSITLIEPSALGPIGVNYTACAQSGQGNQEIALVLTPGVPASVACMLPNTLYAPGYPNATFTVVDNGPCTICP